MLAALLALLLGLAAVEGNECGLVLSSPRDGATIYSYEAKVTLELQATCWVRLEIDGTERLLQQLPRGGSSVSIPLPHGQHSVLASASPTHPSHSSAKIERKRAGIAVIPLQIIEWVEAGENEVIESVRGAEEVEEILQKTIKIYEDTRQLEWDETIAAKRVVSKDWCSSPQRNSGMCPPLSDATYYISGYLSDDSLFSFKVKVEWAPDRSMNVYLFGAGPTPAEMSIPHDHLIHPPISLSEFIATHSCPASEPQIVEDLSNWADYNLTISSDGLHSLNNDGLYWAARVQVVNNQISFTPPLQNRHSAPRQWFFDCLISTLIHLSHRIAHLPNLDFVVGGEVPQALIGGGRPIFSMTKSIAHEDVLMPDLFFRYWDGSVSAYHEFYGPPKMAEGGGAGDRHKWNKRIGKLWWKGTVGGWKRNARGQLVRLSKHHPELMEVEALRLTGPGIDELPEIDPKERIEMRPELLTGTRISPDEMSKFKFLANVHGNGNDWSNRFRALLSSESLVFKQDSTLWEFWERDIQPWKHYVPFARNFSDLPEKLQWARDHDEDARKIAMNAGQFIRNRLSANNVHCYWARLLTEYAKLLNFEPVRTEGSQAFESLLEHDRH